MARASEQTDVAYGRGWARTALVIALLLGMAGAPARAQEPAAAVSEAQLAAVMPGATRLGEVSGEPAAQPAYREDELIGYVFHTREVV